MPWQDRIEVNPAIAHGQACIRGTRVPVSVVVDNLADGETESSIAAAYHISIEDIRAALQYAAAILRERIVPAPPLPRDAA